ncbi:hypothetical protein SFRURICE_020351 [Spodoptera frugiperda]|nr:hypothetical protein SFRURICE_020351 [Spodoptera frugiperda]
MVCLEGKSEVQRLEVFEQDAQRQQRNPGLQPARRSHVRGAGPREPHSAVACCRPRPVTENADEFDSKCSEYVTFAPPILLLEESGTAQRIATADCIQVHYFRSVATAARAVTVLSIPPTLATIFKTRKPCRAGGGLRASPEHAFTLTGRRHSLHTHPYL